MLNEIKEYEKLEATEFEHTRAFLKIQDGCNNFCSYCIIPYARGRMRSKDPLDVINESKKIVENIRIPIPPLPRQEEFVAFIEQLDKSKVIIRESIEVLDIAIHNLILNSFGENS